MEISYAPFNSFILRSPLIAFNDFYKMLSDTSESEDKFNLYLHEKIVQEALYLASPSLHEEMLKYINRGLSDKKEEEKLKCSVIKYLSRMATRCTPFGLFAGCTVGNLGDTTSIILNSKEANKRHTRLDMNYLCALAQDISNNREIKSNLKYFANSSIYRLGEKLRYVEYFYKMTQRVHRLAEVNSSEYLVKILSLVADGAKYKNIVDTLSDDEITTEEASKFIDELISVQMLVSEMEPAVTGPEFLNQIVNKLNKVLEEQELSENIHILKDNLEHIAQLLLEIDEQPIGKTLKRYEEIIELIKLIGTNFDNKHLFQSDMIKPAIKAELNSKLLEEIKDAMVFLNNISLNPENTNLSSFKRAFYERFEEREMPLLEVLDNETGIGYGQSVDSGDLNYLTDDLAIPLMARQNSSIEWNETQSILINKYLEALALNKSTIELTKEDFNYKDESWDNSPPTLGVICSILKDDESGKEIIFKSSGGSSAANLLARFCHVDEQIEKHVLEITKIEQELSQEAIFAEIVHLPESRVGNILLRPVLRPYEIPYLSKSGVSKEFQIDPSDLFVSIKKGRILLRSKRLNKEVIPRLTNAHNFHYRSMPVYQFLCDMQIQGKRGGLIFNLGSMVDEFKWFPRVKYKNVILSSARWIIKQTDLKDISELKENKNLKESISKWRQSLKIPENVLLVDGENEFYIHLGNLLSIKTFLSLIKNRSSFVLEEFLFNPETAIIKNEDGDVFTNEIIFSLFKKQ